MEQKQSEEKTRAHVWVDGLVQGVFFRSQTRREAALRGLHGWVRNLRDGRVEAVFEGEWGAVQGMLEWCRQGPPSAEVTDVKIEYEPVQGETNSFEVRY